MPVRRPSNDVTPVCSDDFAACARLRPGSPADAAVPIPLHPAADTPGVEYVHAELVLAAAAGEWHETITLANAACPEGDPRKLTWAMIDALGARSGHETVAVDAAGLRQLLRVVVAVLLPRAPVIAGGERSD